MRVKVLWDDGLMALPIDRFGFKIACEHVSAIKTVVSVLDCQCTTGIPDLYWYFLNYRGSCVVPALFCKVIISIARELLMIIARPLCYHIVCCRQKASHYLKLLSQKVSSIFRHAP